MDLALNNLQRLICHKTHQTNHTSQVRDAQVDTERYTDKGIHAKIYSHMDTR